MGSIIGEWHMSCNAASHPKMKCQAGGSHGQNCDSLLQTDPRASVETLHLGTCMKIAMETAQCPIDFDEPKTTLEKKFGIPVVLGTHSY